MKIKQQKFIDVPIFELTSFTLHELDKTGLQTTMLGDSAVRYEDRYLVTNIDYTDNTKEYIANMKAKQGLYKDEIVDLKEDIVFAREDGLIFLTQKATYSKKTGIVVSEGDYRSYLGENIIDGSFIKYNNSLRRIESKNVTARYQLSEK